VTRLTLDPSVADQLKAIQCIVELCDADGKVLGKFLPEFDLAEWEPISPDVSEEELDRIEQSTEWYSTEEVIQRLRSQE
jgi:hypothetical protein